MRSGVHADYRDLLSGGVLSMAASTGSQPLEIIKTRQASHPRETVLQACRAARSPGRWWGWWRGLDAKLTESFFKGAIFLFAKDCLEQAAELGGWGKGTFANGALAGGGAGIAQTVIMAPMTFIVTYKVNHRETLSSLAVLRRVGLGAYAGASAVAARQATNWGLRHGFVNSVTGRYRTWKQAPLTPVEKMACGFVGGAMAVTNHPLEVLRVRMQWASTTSQTQITMRGIAAQIAKEHGLMAFWAGVFPRMLISAYNSLFLITISGLVKDRMG